MDKPSYPRPLCRRSRRSRNIPLLSASGPTPRGWLGPQAEVHSAGASGRESAMACFSLHSEVCSGLWLSEAELLQGHTDVARLPGLWGPPSLPAHHGLAAHLSDLGFLVCKPGSLIALPTRLSPGDSGWQAPRTNTPRLFLVVRRLPDELPRSHFTDLEAEAAAILPNSRH